ncbi:MAG: chemotaxis protein CheA [Pirellulaceae bacterium]
MEEITQEFLVESYESLDQLDSDFVALEETPDDRERLASIFRTVHTIKGTSGFLAFSKLEKVAHVGENLLVPLRDGELGLNQNIADGLLGMVDAIRSILSNIESGGSEGDGDYTSLIAKLEELRESGGESSAAPESVDADSADLETNQQSTNSESNLAAANESASSETASTETTIQNAAESVEHTAVASEPEKQEPTPVAVENAPAASPKVEPEVGEKGGSLADSTVRINVRLLDKLMNQVGELVLARNQILQFSNEANDAAMIAASQRLNLITTELQEGVMKTRMQPIRNAWNKLPRVVRDLSAACEKKVEVEMEGAETELDKTILEAIKDPLTHIVRNSVDHGIESAEARVAAGKPETGTLLLRAYHESGQVNIEIVDDGGGINTDRIREKAIEKGIVGPDAVREMSERELTNLILLPGFSTAEKVTNVSGRGVGMDVVKTNIEKIGGSLEIRSETGVGTTLRIKIPLTLAIVPALIVNTGGENYAIPQVSLLELVRLEDDRTREAIEYVHDSPVYRLRGNLLPIVYLDEQLGIRSTRSRKDKKESINIVVLQAEDRQFGLVVDAIHDTQEIVVKPLGPHLKDIPAYAGSTIMGDGTVALILDTTGIARRASVLGEARERSLNSLRVESSNEQRECVSMLLVDPGDDTQAAIPLSTVARLEDFESTSIEQTSRGPVVQYRNSILPLVCFSPMQSPDQLAGMSQGGRLQTVVFSQDDRSIGVLVGKILDIVDRNSITAAAEGSSTAVVNGKVTTLVDLPEWVAANHAHILLG